jgi:DNA polymerase-3 subunit alpha
LDGAVSVNRVFERAKELGFEAIAITDHGNLFGAVKFFQKAVENGIKPIIGCEIYVAPGSRFEKRSAKGEETSYHLTLLVKDERGYKNIVKLVSLGYLEGFYYKPRIDLEILKEYSKGLIALSGCLAGEIPSLILKGRIEEAKKKALTYLSIMGEGNFYLELMRHGIPEQDLVNKGLVELSRDLGIPVVATNDVHYIYPEDAIAHEVLLCIQTGKRLDDPGRMRMETDKLYLRSHDEMVELFKDIPEAISATWEIAEKCNFEFDFKSKHLPLFEVPAGYTLESYLREVALKGLEERKRKGELCENIPYEEYLNRLEYELEIIEETGFSGYFLIVWDFVKWAKSRGIPVGPGRGSAAGALVSYALGITNVDPLRWGLLFERFLNPERVSMPDIDIDFCKERREIVIDYIKKKYGEKNVAKIIAIGSLSARAVVRDVGRALGFSPKEVDRIAKMIPATIGITIKEALALEPRLNREIEENEKVRKLMDIAQRLEGLSRHASTHAAGIVITPWELTEYVPLYKADKDDEDVTTHYDKDDLEALGLLKMDLLGLKTLTVIDTACKLVEQYKGVKIDTDKLPLDDQKTYELLQSGRTEGVFQLESSGMRDLLRRLKPSRFEDLIAIVALYRPGPLQSGMVDEFIERKHGKRPIEYEVPELKEILDETYGVIVYQEQVMMIASKIAGFTLGQADVLRKAMGKKKMDVMQEQKEAFVEGAIKNGYPREFAERLFEKMEKFAEYGFNKSHSASYAFVAYQTAYLKAHYPVEFMAALISSEINNTEKVYLYLNECKEFGIKVLPPDINESHVIFRIEGNSLRFGLAAIKGVGEVAAETIVKIRGNKPFKSFIDFVSRASGSKINRKTVEALIKAGAFDSFGIDRKHLLMIMDDILDRVGKSTKKDVRQFSLFEIGEFEEELDTLPIPDVPPSTLNERLNWEKETLGFFLTGHPLEIFASKVAKYNTVRISDLADYNDGDQVLICGVVVSIKEKLTKDGERMAFVNLEDKTGRVELIVFPSVYKDCDILFTMDEPLLVRGVINLDVDGDSVKVIVNEVALVSKGFDEKKWSCFITIRSDLEDDRIDRLFEVVDGKSGDIPLMVKVVGDEYEVLIDTGMKVAEEVVERLVKEGINVELLEV